MDLTDGTCILGIEYYGDADVAFLLGVPFMQAICTMVDFVNHTIQFSYAKH
jgi:hypothetical protein